MKITRLEECAAMPVNMQGVQDAIKQVPIGKADGAPNFSIRVFTIAPGGHTPHHSHDSEHLNYILEGSGELLDGDNPRAISQGDYILVRPQEKHQYRNTGSTPLKFLCMVPTDYE
ncbi:MAG: cupin domain-containing protein [Gammaproteobacteria bacterium]|nr:cupin domain-containing protein [Gammaproteobacteria bacterium]MCB1851199.1 cupin domain-containing protein [Gammaproteobacteria bacterium]MCP5418792.1 cupin domain-containing protein [Chromatiaceae bacterium]